MFSVILWTPGTLTRLGFYLLVVGLLAVILSWIRPRFIREWLLSQKVRSQSLAWLRFGVAAVASTILLELVNVWYFADQGGLDPDAGLLTPLVGTFASTLLAVGLWCTFLDIASHRALARNTRGNTVILPFISQVGRVCILILGLISICVMLGYNVTGLLAGLGIGGVAIALASKDSLENLFGAVTIVIDMPFGTGDWIKVAGVEGVVEEVNLRSTRIRTFDDSLITLPNSNLIKASVENMGSRRYRRLKTTIHINHAGEEGQVERLIADLQAYIRSVPENVDGMDRVAVWEMKADGTVLQIVAYLEVPDVHVEEACRTKILLEAARLSRHHGLGMFERKPV